MKKNQKNDLYKILIDIRNLQNLTPEKIEAIRNMKDTEKMQIIIEYNIILQTALANFGIEDSN